MMAISMIGATIKMFITGIPGMIVGGAVAPAVAGTMVQQIGITVVPQIALAAIGLGLVIVVVAVP